MTSSGVATGNASNPCRATATARATVELFTSPWVAPLNHYVNLVAGFGMNDVELPLQPDGLAGRLRTEVEFIGRKYLAQHRQNPLRR